MFVRTSDTPSHVDFDALNKKANSMKDDLVQKGMSFPAATRRVDAEIAEQDGLLYYEGANGVFRRK
jgi:hypothetical protein